MTQENAFLQGFTPFWAPMVKARRFVKAAACAVILAMSYGVVVKAETQIQSPGSGSSSGTPSATLASGSVVPSTFTVAAGSSTFNGPVRVNVNGFVVGPGTAQAADAGDPSAGSAYFQLSATGGSNIGLEFKHNTGTRADMFVDGSNNYHIRALAGDLYVDSPSGAVGHIRSNGSDIITVNDTGAQVGLYPRTTAQLQALAPVAAFQLILNSSSGDVCMSTGTGVSAWVLIRSTTTACD